MAKPPNSPPARHEHNYVTKRTQKAQDGTNRTVYHMECVAAGKCDRPYKMEIK